jgi:CRP-like cAMP-binding protein
VIYHQGDEADSLYIFNRGAVRLEVTTPNRRRKIVRIFANGHVFGEEAYIREGSHQTAAVAQIVGANRPHVSAIMFDLEKRGLVRCQGTKLLVNEQELAKQIDTEALP